MGKRPKFREPAKAIIGKAGKYNQKTDWATKYVPQSIYFYYINPRTTPPTRAIYFVDLMAKITDIRPHIISLTKNARITNLDAQNPRPIGLDTPGYRPQVVPWWRRSYLVVVLDDGKGFYPGEAVEITRYNGHPNHCFFDGGDGTIDPGDGAPLIYAMWTVNYMKNEYGDDIPKGKVHRFRFRFKGIREQMRYPEDSGTNMGPPVPPP
jgi:hypothetical protein